jgi:hypothetical protein
MNACAKLGHVERVADVWHRIPEAQDLRGSGQNGAESTSGRWPGLAATPRNVIYQNIQR